MMTATRFIAAIVIYLVSGLPVQADQGEDTFQPLVIETRTGLQKFLVEIAATPEKRAVGLMGRQSMPENRGMLFDFGTDQHISMWMKNTYIPLDMAFISNKGVIKKIVKRTVPHSLAPITSGQPVRAVLELNGGLTDRLKISIGDLVRHPIFKNTK